MSKPTPVMGMIAAIDTIRSSLSNGDRYSRYVDNAGFVQLPADFSPNDDRAREHRVQHPSPSA